MSYSLENPEYIIRRDQDRCINCQVCERQCSNEAHFYDEDMDQMRARDENCVNCQRCVTLCPTDALSIEEYPLEYKENSNWTGDMIKNVYKQAESGGVLLTGMGNPTEKKIYWDHILLNASQVTNPSIDPLREPMELKTFIGRKPDRLEFDEKGEEENGDYPPQIELETPIMFSAMSFGSISLNACKSLARAASDMGIMYNTGEGGLHEDLYEYKDNTIVQVASGRFGVHQEYLEAGAAIEIKIGQGAKPGIGGHLPGEKVKEEISKTRMIPEGTDALSPAPHHDIYSIEDLRQLIYALKEATDYKKPVFVKISAVHNVAAIAAGMATAGADTIVIDGYRGGTGAAPTMIRDNVGIPVELALAAVDDRLREENLRNNVSLVIAGTVRNSADVVKAIGLGADAVYIGSAALIAMGCHMCQKCYTGNCNWGIATQDSELVKRLNPEIGEKRLKNLIKGWSLEIKEMLGGMGINAVESLRGNRLMLRGIDLSAEELDILGIKHAGQ